jgi:capsular exopolysaccharide synthesis family protein
VVSDGLVRGLWRYRWIMLFALLLGAAAGAWMVSRTSPVYVSSSRILFQERPESVESLAPTSYVQTQAELMGSSTILNDASVELGKEHLRTLSASSDVFGSLKHNLKMIVGKDDGTLTISFSGPAGTDNSAVVNSVVHAYRRYLDEHTGDGPREMLLALDRQKAEVNSRLTENLRAMNTFRSRNGAIDNLPGAKTNDLERKQLATLNSELLEAQSNVVAPNAKYDSLVARYGIAENHAVSAPVSGSASAKSDSGTTAKSSDETDGDPAWIQNQMSLATANLDLLRSRGLPDNNPSVQEAKSAVDRLTRQLSAARRGAALAEVTQAASELESAKRQAASLQTAYDAQNKAWIERDAKRAELLGLQESIDRMRKESEELDSQIKQVRDNLSKSVELTVLSEAQPVESSTRRDARIIAITSAVGLLLGCCLSLGLYATDQRLRSPVEVGRLLRLPVIGVIPNMPGGPSLAVCGLTTHTNPMSSMAEAARTVRSAIFFAGRSTSARTIVVTSAGKNEGKSAFASNLAIAMAQAGSLTLLLDANFKDPKIPEIFEISRLTGLSDVLAGKLQLDRAITRTAIERLEVLNCGSAPRNPAELLNSGGFSRLIEQLNQRYQCIVLDAPPVAKDADARILAASADLTVFVVRAGSTPGNAADLALEQLLSVGARVLGAVLNDVILRKPMERFRGILRFVETSPEELSRAGMSPPQSSPTFRSGAASGNSGTLKQRTESNSVPEVEVVD